MIEVIDISNISRQLITIGYSKIDQYKSVTAVPHQNSGILKLVSGSTVLIEADRIKFGEIQNIANKKLINYKIYSVEPPERPQKPFFNSSITCENDIVEITPTDILSEIAYWSVQNLPSGYSFDEETGIITGPYYIIEDHEILINAVGVNGLVYTRNYILDTSWILFPGYWNDEGVWDDNSVWID